MSAEAPPAPPNSPESPGPPRELPLGGAVRERSAELGEYFAIRCPHAVCGLFIVVKSSDVNCRIFRHGAGLGPHAPKAQCDAHNASGRPGCGGPFRFDPAALRATICDYI
jgi:hypothetical protein